MCFHIEVGKLKQSVVHIKAKMASFAFGPYQFSVIGRNLRGIIKPDDQGVRNGLK